MIQNTLKRKKNMMNPKLNVGLELEPLDHRATCITATPPITDTSCE